METKRIALTCLLSLIFISWAEAQSVFTPPINRAMNVSVASGDSIQIRTYRSRSYCCSLLRATTGGPEVTFLSFLGNSDSNNNGASRSQDGLTLDITTGDRNSVRRFCWHDGVTGTPTTTSLTYSISSPPFVGEVLCEETTLRGNFNTVAADFSFLELTMKGRSGITGLNKVSVSGVIILKTTFSSQSISIPFTIQANNGESVVRRDFSIHDAIGSIDDFGSVEIIHNGARTQLTARVTQYKSVDGIATPVEAIDLIQAPVS